MEVCLIFGMLTRTVSHTLTYTACLGYRAIFLPSSLPQMGTPSLRPDSESLGKEKGPPSPLNPSFC